MTSASATESLASKARLAIIAGSGKLPLFLAQAARAAGEDPFILRLKNEADADWQGYETAVIGVGDMAGLSALFDKHRIGRVVMSGAVRKRPSFGEIHVNLRSVLKLPMALKTLLAGGDDAVLRMVISLIEAQGCQVVGAHEILPGLLATVGPLGKVMPSREDIQDMIARQMRLKPSVVWTWGRAPSAWEGESWRSKASKVPMRCWLESRVCAPRDASQGVARA